MLGHWAVAEKCAQTEFISPNVHPMRSNSFTKEVIEQITEKLGEQKDIPAMLYSSSKSVKKIHFFSEVFFFFPGLLR